MVGSPGRTWKQRNRVFVCFMRRPNWEYEKRLWGKGMRVVAGVDEVGRGAWAGPLVAAAVVFPKSEREGDLKRLQGLRDSKKLTEKKRREFCEVISDLSLSLGIGVVEPKIIDREGITSATGRAMRKALANLAIEVDHVLVDHFYIGYFLKDKQTAIKKGDEKSLSVAAASVVAKVFRDDLMRKFAKRKSRAIYGWERNKGYGTREHREAIRRHGVCEGHRKLFVKTCQPRR